MGLDLGLERAGCQIVFAIDSMKEAVDTGRLNRPSLPMVQADVSNVTAGDILHAAGRKNIDVLAGGPPCQSFSTAGRRRALDDRDRGPLIFEFARLIDELRPRAYILENVPGLLSASQRWRKLPYNNNGKRIDEHHGSLFSELSRRLNASGYSVSMALLMAADFGVPQRRQRVFVVGFRTDQEFEFPTPTHCEHGSLLLPRWRTLADALDGLQSDGSPCAVFSERKLKYLRMVPPGGNWRDLPLEVQRESMGKAFYAKGGRSGFWRRLAFGRPSPTILTEPQNASTALCHPAEDRPLSVAECARVQTFPDDWQFVGSRSRQYQLVGNAVPPLLAEAVARSLVAQLASGIRKVA
jgi:DNA (cytosine-5)-methyltransferase 1